MSGHLLEMVTLLQTVNDFPTEYTTYIKFALPNWTFLIWPFNLMIT